MKIKDPKVPVLLPWNPWHLGRLNPAVASAEAAKKVEAMLEIIGFDHFEYDP